MKQLIVIIAVIALIGALLFVLNPDDAAFGNFVQTTVTSRLSGNSGTNSLGNFLAKTAGSIAGSLAKGVYTRHNYYLFSVYDLNLKAIGFKGTTQYLGIAGLFFEF